jgi:pimeloyl-ACP methyl ester carboxylesterase
METETNRLQSLKYPVVVLISGSGPQDRDETLFNHKPFAVIADNLSRLGFAVLRVDDRGVAKTSGKFSTATSADFADDVEAGIEYLKTHPNVDTTRIGLIGHSEGGMIAPMVASRRKDIKFIVLLAGPGIPIVQLMAEQAEAVAKSSGSTPAFARAGAQLYTLAATEVNKKLDSVSTFNNMRSSLEAWIIQQPANVITGLHLTSSAEKEAFMHAQLNSLQSPWFKYFLAFDPTPYLQKLRCSVLALNGAKDIQVLPTSNLAGILAALKKSHSKSYEVKEVPGLNHLFQTCNSCTAKEYGELEETFSPMALKMMDDWLLKQTGQKENSKN